jgi:hypothetical protein
VWAKDNPPRLAQNIPSVVTELKLGVIHVSQRQYYIHHKVQTEIQKLLDRLPPCSQLDYCYFTPVVPNLYILLGLIPGEAKFFTCLNFKDIFFCIHLAPQSQPIFAFQWESSSTEIRDN